MTRHLQNQYNAKITQEPEDIRAAQELRRLCFIKNADLLDSDAFDDQYQHVMIYDGTDELVCTFRFAPLTTGRDVGRTYSAVFYDLAPLHDINSPMIEMGRFCTHPERNDPNILRFAWSILTGYVDQNNVALLFGCSSFQGTDVCRYRDAFALLKHRYLAPAQLSPGVKSAHIHAFGAVPMADDFDLKAATKSIPPLLRTYLAMGGRVSDHAVLDHQLNTTHVFTAVAIDKIPDTRKRWLRAGVT